MALPPKFAGHRLTFPGLATSTTLSTPSHTLELYLDYVCPYSASASPHPHPTNPN